MRTGACGRPATGLVEYAAGSIRALSAGDQVSLKPTLSAPSAHSKKPGEADAQSVHADHLDVDKRAVEWTVPRRQSHVTKAGDEGEQAKTDQRRQDNGAKDKIERAISERSSNDRPEQGVSSTPLTSSPTTAPITAKPAETLNPVQI